MNEQTPGPLTAHKSVIYWFPPGKTVDHGYLHIAAVTERDDRFVSDANARLLAAAYTAFDTAGRNLGIDAAELAERIDLAALIQTAGTILDLAQVGADYTGQEIDQEMVTRFKKLLAQARGC